MSRTKKPSKSDRERLELLTEAINNETFECSCDGENEACSDCKYTLEPEDFSIRNVDYDRLAVTVRLSDISPRSELARKYNTDNDFADIVDWIQENVEDLDELSKVSMATNLLEEFNSEGEGEVVSAHKRLRQL